MAESTDSKKEFELKCDVCRLDDSTVEASSVCVDCMEGLCTDCLVSHSGNEILKAHKTLDKATLPVILTSEILQELKAVINCTIHELQKDYICQEHAVLICHMCRTKKEHRSCRGIAKIRYSPPPMMNEEEAMENQIRNVKRENMQHILKAFSDEKEKQENLKSTILAGVQAFFVQLDNSSENDPYVEDDKHGDLLRVVSQLGDEEKATIVVKHIELSSAENIPLLVAADKRLEHEKMNISKRLEILDNAIAKVIKVDPCTTATDSSKHEGGIVAETSVGNTLDTTPTHKDTETQTQFEYVPAIDEVQASDTTVNQITTESADADTEPCDAVAGAQCRQVSHSVDVHSQGTQCVVINKVDGGSQTFHKDFRQSVIPLSNRSLEFAGTYNVSVDNASSICGIVVLKNRQVVMIDETYNTMKLFDEYFHLKYSRKLDWRPIDMCVVDKECALISVSYTPKKIEIYKVHDSNIAYIRGFNLSLHCRGISAVSYTTIAVLLSNEPFLDDEGDINDINSNDDTVIIQFRDVFSGKILNTLSEFDKEVRDPVFIMQDPHGNIIIGEENMLSAYDDKSDRVWFYKTNRGNTLKDVYGMAIDPEGNIYACSNGNNSIHQVSSSNYRNSRVIIPYVPSPGAIAYDESQERLIVGCTHGNCVYVYRFV